MTFEALTPDPSYMRDQEFNFFNSDETPDSELLRRHVVSAKKDLLDDLQAALSLDPSDADDAATLDGYIDDHAGRMQRALSIYCILYWFQSDAMGGINLDKLDYWRAQCKRLRQGFPALKTKRGTAESYSYPTVR